MQKEETIIDLFQAQRPESSAAVFWQWQSGPNPDPWAEKDPVKRTWKNYSDDDCLIIEEAFSLNKEVADLGNYEVDFKRMVQVNKKDKSRIRRVRRVRRQGKSQFMMEMSEPKAKTINQAFGTVQHFLEYIMKRAPEAYGMDQRLKKLTIDSKNSEFEDIIKEVVGCIEKGAEMREKTFKSARTEAKKIISRIGDGSGTLFDFLRTILNVYTKENFLCSWLNELLINEDWEGINVLTPYLVCLAETFKRTEYIIKCQELQGLMKIMKKQKICLYKGAALSKKDLKLYDPQKMKHFSWNGITSTSRDETVALNFMKASLKEAQKQNQLKTGVLFKIEGKFGSPEEFEGIIDLWQNLCGQYPDEQEVILAPGTVFQLRKTRLIEGDIYEVSLKIKKRSEEPKEDIALLGNLQQEKVIIEGLPSRRGLKLLAMLKENRFIQKLEIRDSGIEENIMEKVEEMRATTGMRKQDIKLRDNTIVIGSLGSLAYYFSEENLNEILMWNQIRFKEAAGAAGNFGIKALSLNEEILKKFKQTNQLKELYEKIKGESDVTSLDLALQLPSNEIFICIKELKGLQSLRFKVDKKWSLSKESLELLCETIMSLSALKKLHLEFTASDEGLHCLGRMIESLKCLECLSLNFNGCNEVSDEGLSGLIFPASLKQLSLNFNSCRKISDQGAKALLISQTALQHLSLEFNECTKISNRGLGHLKDVLGELISLKKLSLSFEKCAKISDEGLSLLGKGLESLKSLEHLSLNFNECNEILDGGLCSIKKALVELKSLEQLSLSFNGCNEISGEGLGHLKDGVLALNFLKHLSLYFSENNEISDKGLNAFKDCLISLTGLQHLSLHFHLCRKISNEGINNLKDGLAGLTSLKHLSLEFSGRNNISDEGLKNLKDGLMPLISLQHLSLDFSWCNKISDEGLKHLGESLTSLPSLQYLSLNFKKSDNLLNEGVNHLVSGVLSLKSLQHISLNFSWCFKISDEGLGCLKGALLSLKSLNTICVKQSSCP